MAPAKENNKEIHSHQFIISSPELRDTQSSMPMANNLRSVFRPLQIHLLVLILRPFLLKAADPLYYFCGSTGNFTVNSTYGENLSSLLSSISSDNSVTYGFYNLSSGQSPDQVNGIALCRGDVALSDCRTCIKNSSLEIVRQCPVQKEAIIYYDNCLLRYSDQPIFGVVASGYVFYMWNPNNATSVTEFNQVLRELMDGLRSRAAAGSSIMKFAARNTTAPDFQTLYGLAQCTPDLSELECNDCLVAAIGNIPQCCNSKRGGRVVGPSCNIRFEVYRFYDPSVEAQAVPPASPPVSPPNPTTNATVPPPEGKSSTTTMVIIVVASVAAVCLLVVTVFCITRRKLTRRIENNEAADEIMTAESLQYDFETVRAATDNFSDENKLGQGGFGTVYKGQLANGQEIAVKRLSRGLGQGDQEFKTEVLLVARLQHRNLVRLLGFCLSGDERLLVYEFLPNSSLDRFIFDPVKRQQLDWERRQKIIGGIARGLVYLHEDSQLRIIHRDLKASNILLDAAMTPKISDFGMARLFVVDQTQAATSRIVGTYGYMAPEYALYGQFSVKSDVFSFGILVLEIVSGQKNNCFRSGETVQDLLSFAWRNWREGTVSNIIDPSLGNDGSRTEIQRCIHIGLLCVQENAANRPSMASVVLMLNSFSISLPLPSQPAIYMHSNMESTGSFLAMDNSGGTGSDESKSKSYRGSVDEDPITDLFPR